jgi:hypothetical protein
VFVTKPRFVILDTATISRAAKYPTDVQVKELLRIFHRGDWIPFVTFHQLEEASLGNSKDFRKRFDFLRSLPHVGYLALPENRASIGKCTDLQIFEIECLAAHPNATHAEIIEAVRPKVCSGFGAGEEIVNFEFWEHYREKEAPKRRQRFAELANTNHFLIFDINQKLPEKGEIIQVCSKQEALLRAKQQANWLGRQICERGDHRGINPQTTATGFLQEIIQECRDEDFAAGKLSYDEFLERAGVKRDRMPANPTEEDFICEAAFVMEIEAIARRLLKNKNELLHVVRKEQLPSWVVWNELHRKILRMPKSQIGNGNDKNIAAFGLYVDVLDVDKRIVEMLQQSSRENSLLLEVFKRVPKKRGLIGVLEAIEN